MDTIIRNGTIIDGSRAPRWTGDLGIDGGKISAMGDLKKANAATVIDATGMVVAPGFVDILNHSDAYLTLFHVPSAESLVRQGITTILGGNCGASLAPFMEGNLIAVIQKWGDIREINVNWERFSELLEELERKQLGVNFASLVGHATLRRGLLGDTQRGLHGEELRRARKLFEDALSEGAFGLSYAPAYVHAKDTPRHEISALLEPISRAKGLFSVHMRDEGADSILALKDALSLAEELGLNVEISHLKVAGKRFWDLGKSLLDQMNEVSARNSCAVHFDVYPYQTMSIVGYLLLPDWAHAGGRKAILERLRNRDLRAKIIEDMKALPYDYENIIVAVAHRDRTYAGKNIGEAAKAHGLSPQETVVNLLLANEGRLIVFEEALSIDNLRLFLKDGRSFVATAGAGYDSSWAKRGELVHPRSFGAFPKVLSQFVRQEKLLSLEEAVHKMSGGPARKIGLKNRGELKQGYAADVVIFDPNAVQDTASFPNPYQYPEGIRYVMVNGKIAVNQEGLTSTRAGKVLRRA